MIRLVGVRGTKPETVSDVVEGIERNTGGTGDPESAKSVASEAAGIGVGAGGISEPPQSQPVAPQSFSSLAPCFAFVLVVSDRDEVSQQQPGLAVSRFAAQHDRLQHGFDAGAADTWGTVGDSLGINGCVRFCVEQMQA